MDEIKTRIKTVLITGGTSGLGLELVKLYLRKGFYVIATGRHPINLSGYTESFRYISIDFNDLQQVAVSTKKICDDFDIDILINNAGILSPPDYTLTKNGLEYTFQVNFLSHLLINETIIQLIDDKSLIIAAVISPVYRLADNNTSFVIDSPDYKPFKAYSNSKLFMTLMCHYISEKYKNKSICCFSFDPGTFRSGIYRMQKRWFQALYGIAAPFMRSPAKVASVLADIIINDKLQNGAIYDLRKRVRQIPETDKLKTEAFWKSCYNLIHQI